MCSVSVQVNVMILNDSSDDSLFIVEKLVFCLNYILNHLNISKLICYQWLKNCYSFVLLNILNGTGYSQKRTELASTPL